MHCITKQISTHCFKTKFLTHYILIQLLTHIDVQDIFNTFMRPIYPYSYGLHIVIWTFIWVGSWRCVYLSRTWFCYHFIAKSGINKATPSRLDPHDSPKAIAATMKDNGKIDRYQNITSMHTIYLIHEMIMSSYIAAIFCQNDNFQSSAACDDNDIKMIPFPF